MPVGRSSRNKAKGRKTVGRSDKRLPTSNSGGRKQSGVRSQSSPVSKTADEHTIERHLALSRWIVHRLYGHIKCRATYDELLAAALVGLWKSIEGYDPTRAKFSTYATLKIRGHLKDWLRIRNRQGYYAARSDLKFENWSGLQWHVHSDLVGRRDPTPPLELREECEKVLSGLCERDRAFIHDRFWLGLNNSETAAKHGCKTQWVQFCVARALKQLREKYAPS